MRRTFFFLCIIALLIGVISGTVLKAQGPPDLESLHQGLLPVFELNGVVFTDADERTGRFTIGVSNRGLETALRARLNAMGASALPVDVVVADPILPLTSLRDYLRPIQGGMQVRWDAYVCTLGFNAIRSGTGGFAMNSHCTTKQGGVQSTKYYQPLNQTAAEFIGTETVDPAYRKGSGCARGKNCRYSDSAFARRDAAVSDAGQGFIAKPDSINTGSLTIGADRFRITSKGPSSVGQIVNKVGRTTGWTQGVVTGTCVNTAVSGSNIVQLCQDFVSAGVGGGDSSSPVFAIPVNGLDDVELRGILWGGNAAGTQFVYSPIANVQRNDELGPLQVCAAGYSC